MFTQRESTRNLCDDSRWKGDFALLWGGSSISLLGSECAATAGPLLALLLTGSPIFAGWIVFARTAPSLLLPLVAGAMVDRFDRRHAMLVCQTGRLALAVGLFTALSTHAEAAPLILGWAFADGALSMIYTTAETAIIPQIVPPDRLSKALAKSEARGHAALLGGRPLGGLLFGIGPAWPFVAEAVSSIISMSTLVLMRSRPVQKAGDVDVRIFTSEGLQRIWRDSFLRVTLIICTATNFLFQSVVLLLVMLAQEQGLSALQIGVLLAAPSVGGLVASLLAPRVLHRLFKNRFRAVVVPCVLGWFSAVALIALSEQSLVWFLAWAGVGFFGVHMNIALSIHQAETVPSELLGRVVSANRFISLGLILPLGALCGGYSIDRWGPRTTAVLIVVVMAALVLVTVLLRKAAEGPDDGARGDAGASIADETEPAVPAGEDLSVLRAPGAPRLSGGKSMVDA